MVLTGPEAGLLCAEHQTDFLGSELFKFPVKIVFGRVPLRLSGRHLIGWMDIWILDGRVV
jgi:hypothetical protein